MDYSAVNFEDREARRAAREHALNNNEMTAYKEAQKAFFAALRSTSK